MTTSYDDISLEETDKRFSLEIELIEDELTSWKREERKKRIEKETQKYLDKYNKLTDSEKWLLENQGITNADEYVKYWFEKKDIKDSIEFLMEGEYRKRQRKMMNEFYENIMPEEYIKLLRGISYPGAEVTFTNPAQIKLFINDLGFFENLYSKASTVTGGGGALGGLKSGPVGIALGITSIVFNYASENYEDAIDDLKDLMERGETANVKFGIGDLEVTGG